MMRRAAFFASLLLFTQSAFAVTSISISADNVSDERVELQQAHIVLDLTKAPQISFNSALKRKADNVWIQAHLSCEVPNRLMSDIWRCPQGIITAERINIPFSVNLTPQPKGVEADLNLKEASFSDTSGLHAAEKLSGRWQVGMVKDGEDLRWHQSLVWTNGEMFWQPFYLTGSGHQFSAFGKLDNNAVAIEDAKLDIKNVGKLHFKGEMQLKDYQLTSLDADLTGLDLASAYPLIFKPLLEKTAFNHAKIGGQADLKVSVKNNELKSFHLVLNDTNIDDNNHKFAFYHIQADIPWSYDEPKNVRFSYQNGHLLNIPLGKTDIQAEVNRYALTAPTMLLPILDGALKLSDISAARIGANWHGHLAAEVLPISMPQLSSALKWPQMQGQVSAQIPQVTYSGGILTVNGEMLFNVFDGKATVTNLTLHQPLSSQPVLQADMNLRNLDLGQLTRTFSFGAIEGKLDGDVANLEMQNWKTVKLDAKVQSSPGKYPKKISQRAVQNISALGGAGAAAAIQRSFLRFFEQFNYEKIGLSCQLRNDICQMGGVESTQGGYVIVKGSGIPAITVMGYNHTVGWSELLSRIKRITDSNTKAIVK
ncbi:MAG: hypothetical protein SFU55_05080 [Methylophilus sp.]|nr:hypothetical protein [Methylophilus sp.]